MSAHRRSEIAQLKRIASKLPPIPLDLTAKNKALLRKFESDRLQGRAPVSCPSSSIAEVTKALETGRVDFVKAQVAVAIDFQLAIPLRPQNLSRLNWQRHFIEPDGPRGRLLLHIPKAETKSRQQDFIAEVPDHVARRLRWYRRHILPRLNADVNGDLFVTEKGIRKDQETITIQITRAIEDHLGIHMTPHQFRHLAGRVLSRGESRGHRDAQSSARPCLEQDHPIYVGSSSRRASRAYNRFVFEKREALKLKRKRQRTRNRKKGTHAMRKLKHLPLEQWPEADIEAFASAYEPGDIFDESRGPGAHPRRGHAQDDQDRLAALAGLFGRALSGRSPEAAGRPHYARPGARLHRPPWCRSPADHGCHRRRQPLLRRTPDRTDNRLALAGLDQAPPCCARASPRTASTDWFRLGIPSISASS